MGGGIIMEKKKIVPSFRGGSRLDSIPTVEEEHNHKTASICFCLATGTGSSLVNVLLLHFYVLFA